MVFDQSWIATPEPGPARLPFKMLTHRRMIKCIQPQDWFAAIDLKDAYFMFRSFHDTDRSTVCVRGSGMAVQGPPLRALPVRPCLHEDRGGCPCPITGSGHQDPQLSQAWPHARTVMRSQGPGASAPQPVGASGQLGKEQALPCAENLFSWCGVDSVSMSARLTRKSAPSQC